MERPLVSVIVPMYNVEKYVEKCMLSVMNQTYKNIEIIVVDNKSKDSSVSIVKRLKKQDDRITLIQNKENHYVGYSRNVGLKKAKGDYIWFVDSDDYAETNCLEKMVQYIEESGVNIVQCCYTSFTDYGDESDYLPYHENGFYSGRELDVIMAKFIGLCGPNTMIWNKLYRREVFDSFRFYERQAYEDMHLMYKILYNEERVLWVADRLMHWRKSLKSNTAITNYADSLQDELTAYIERIDFYREKGDAELVSLTYKRLYYTATQHYYLNKYYSEEEGKMKRESVIKAILKDSWLKLKNDKYFGARTKLRFIWIHLFPMEFGRRSIKHKVDFTI